MLNREEILRGTRPSVGAVTHAGASLSPTMCMCGATLAAPGVRVTSATTAVYTPRLTCGKGVSGTGSPRKAHSSGQPSPRSKSSTSKSEQPSTAPPQRCGTRSAAAVHTLDATLAYHGDPSPKQRVAGTHRSDVPLQATHYVALAAGQGRDVAFVQRKPRQAASPANTSCALASPNSSFHLPKDAQAIKWPGSQLSASASPGAISQPLHVGRQS